MKLTGLLLTLSVYCIGLKGSYAKSTTHTKMNDDLLERAAQQLGRLSAFRMIGEPHLTVPRIQSQDNEYQAIPIDTHKTGDILEVQKRMDQLRATASALLQEPKYQAIMQDRIKRSFISGIANKLVGGVVGAASGASRGIAGLSSSNTPSDYGSYGYSYQTKFDIGDFAKAIINTLVQAIKAISGGAIAGGGALVKGGGYLVSAKGQIISSAGSAITSLGKSIASSAIIASPKPVYGHPGYSYNPQAPENPSHDASYDGPPPSADAYAGPGDAYNEGHSSYAAPSNDDGVDNQGGILIVKETKPADGLDNHSPSSSTDDFNPNLSISEDSFGGLSKGPSSIITKITGILNSGQLPVSDQDHREENVSYYPQHDDQQPPSSVSSYESGFQSNHDVENSEGTNYQSDGQLYDSYGTKVQQYSVGFTSSHANGEQVQQNHQPPSLLALDTHLAVPKPQAPTHFKEISSSADYSYNSNKHQSEPLKIPIFTSHQNSLDNHIESSKYYGLPNYDSTPVLGQSSIGLNVDSSYPSLPAYNNYQGPNAEFNQHIHNPSSIVGNPAILSAWNRISRTMNHPVKKAARISKGLEIQRSIGYYALTNGKLSRI